LQTNRQIVYVLSVIGRVQTDKAASLLVERLNVIDFYL